MWLQVSLTRRGMLLTVHAAEMHTSYVANACVLHTGVCHGGDSSRFQPPEAECHLMLVKQTVLDTLSIRPANKDAGTPGLLAGLQHKLKPGVQPTAHMSQQLCLQDMSSWGPKLAGQLEFVLESLGPWFVAHLQHILLLGLFT